MSGSSNKSAARRTLIQLAVRSIAMPYRRVDPVESAKLVHAAADGNKFATACRHQIPPAARAKCNRIAQKTADQRIHTKHAARNAVISCCVNLQVAGSRKARQLKIELSGDKLRRWPIPPFSGQPYLLTSRRKISRRKWATNTGQESTGRKLGCMGRTFTEAIRSSHSLRFDRC